MALQASPPGGDRAQRLRVQESTISAPPRELPEDSPRLRQGPQPGPCAQGGAALCHVGVQASCGLCPVCASLLRLVKRRPSVAAAAAGRPGLIPPSNRAEKGLEAAAAGTFSQRGLRRGPPRDSARGLAGPVCPASAPTAVSRSPVSGLAPPLPPLPLPALVSCCFNEGLASCVGWLSSSAFN